MLVFEFIRPPRNFRVDQRVQGAIVNPGPPIAFSASAPLNFGSDINVLFIGPNPGGPQLQGPTP